ncbi:MAG TPA: hypothetical protein VF258_07600, partial [Luteolibacter sp.]
GRKLLEHNRYWCMLPFGKGLIEAGDDSGVEFISMKYADESINRRGYPGGLFYHLEQRLDMIRTLKSPKVENFIREILDMELWLDLVLFKPGSVKIETGANFPPPKNEAEALEMSAPRIIRIYGAVLECVKLNRLKSLSGKLRKIAAETSNETIRLMTEKCLNSIE